MSPSLQRRGIVGFWSWNCCDSTSPKLARRFHFLTLSATISTPRRYRMAVKCNALLYAVFAVVALHQTKAAASRPSDISSFEAAAQEHYEQYSSLMFKEHREELDKLSQVNVATVYMTATIMRTLSYVMLSERSVEPYHPPVAWLRVVNSQSHILHAARELLVVDDNCVTVARLLHHSPVAWDDDNGVDKRHELHHILLHRPGLADTHKSPDERRATPFDCQDDPDAWDHGTQLAYEKTLSYISVLWLDMKRKEPLSSLGRGLTLFPIFIDKRFIELVEERRPRALVILGHYFALLTALQNVWFIGDTGRRETLTIVKCLPPEWQDLMQTPLEFIRKV